MRKGLTELVFILDRSGSMNGLESDTVGGFNSMISKQKKEEGEALVSVVLFNERSTVVRDRVDLDSVEPMKEEDYQACGCTALLDAVGDAVRHIGTIHKYARSEDRPERTLFVITTDGLENSSRRYSYSEVKRLIERQQEKYGWEFIFLGANIDAAAEAQRFGIRRDHAAEYVCDEAGTALNYEVLSDTVACVRKGKGFSGAALDRVRKDCRKRGGGE